MKNREYHLTFCSECLHRKMNLQQGLICRLTNKIAEFDTNCFQFELDKKERKRLIENLKYKIEEKYLPDTNLSIFTSHFDNSGIFKEIKIDKYDQVPEIKQNQKFKIGIINIVAGSISIIIGSIIALISIKNFTYILFFFLGIVALILGIKSVLDKEIYFTWTNDYLQLKKLRVYFNDILLTGEVERSGGDGMISSCLMIIGTKTKGLIEFDTYELDGVTTNGIECLIKNNTQQ